MAETLVLAELSIDAQGVVTGVAVTKDALGQAADATDKVGKAASRSTGLVDKLSDRMFSLRHVAVALVGSFSLAGAVLGFKAFIDEVVRGDPAFENLTKSVAGLNFEFQALVRGAAGIGAGLNEAITWTDRLAAAIAGTREAAAAHPEAMAAGRQGLWAGIMFGIPGAARLIGSIQSLGNAMDQLFAGQIENIKKFREVGGVSLLDEWLANLKAAEEGLAGLEKGSGVGTVSPGFKLIDGTIAKIATRLPDALTAVEDASNPLRETWQDLDQFSGEIASGWETTDRALQSISETDISDHVKSIIDLGDAFDVLGETMTTAQLQFALILAAVQQFAHEAATAIVNGGVTFRSFTKDMLSMVGEMLLAWGALAVITTYFTGYPGFHVAYAAIAAGIGALLAARALGGGTPEHRSTDAQSQARGGTTSNLSINFVGGMNFGINEAAFGRYVTDLLRRGEGTNA